MDTFTKAYTEAALWLAMDGASEELDTVDARGREAGIDAETLKRIEEDCADFQESAGDCINTDLVRAGHDFLLTRNRHGAGFWDGDWADDVGKRMTELSHPYGDFTLVVNADGTIGHMG